MRYGEIRVAVAPEWFDDGTNSVTRESGVGDDSVLDDLRTAGWLVELRTKKSSKNE